MTKKLSYAIICSLIIRIFISNICTNYIDTVSAESFELIATFYKFYRDEIDAKNEINSITTGNIIGAINIINTSNTDKSIVLIAALYKNNQLVDIVWEDNIIEAQSSKIISNSSNPLNVTLSENSRLEDYSMKMFLWNNVDEMIPITDTKCLDTAEYEYDIVVYGGNAAGIIAAVQSAKMGKSVAVIEPGIRIGGLTTGGLGDTDVGKEEAIGGLSLEFYKRVGAKYGESKPKWRFEAKVALEVMQDYVRENNIPVFYKERLDLNNGVRKDGTRITAIKMESGKIFKAKMFIDASYEGDLMAKSGVSYFVGREANSVYGETINGIRNPNEHNAVPKGIDPYIVKGEPSSGLLPRVNPDPGGKVGEGDNRVQAYNFRWNLTNVPENRVMVEKPEDYNELDYEILFRAIEVGLKPLEICKLSHWLPNGKVDANNNSGVSTDYIGMNYDYPEGDYETREKIIKAHETYQKGLLWTLQNHSRVPEEMRAVFREWGLPKDEFLENNHWPPQIYVREARRMVSDFVITQHVCQRKVPVNDSVGMGSYAMDSHHIQYYVRDGELVAEGDMMTRLNEPYSISYRSIIPKADECSNLLVPVCVSASHAAYGSIRMEPVFMILGQSAATAASIAIDDGVDVQNVDYEKLSERLKQDGQILYKSLPDEPKDAIIIDNNDSACTFDSDWIISGSTTGIYGLNYAHDGKRKEGWAKWTPTIEKAGNYEIYMWWTSHSNRPNAVPLEIVYNGQVDTSKTVNQQENGGQWVYIGTYYLSEGTDNYVKILSTGTGYTIADAVKFQPVD